MKSKVFYCMTLVMVLSIVGTMNAGTISVSISNATSLPSNDSMQSTDLAGAPGVRVANWNNWTKDDETLGDDGLDIIDDSGASTGLIATMSPADRFASRDDLHGNDLEMFSDVIDVWAAVRTVSVSSIPYDVYDVYVYMRDDGAGRAGEFTIGLTTYYARGGVGNPAGDGTGYVLSTDTTLDDPTTIDQGNYVRFSGISGTSFDLVMDAIAAGDLNRNKVAGFQIVEVPEPATMSLLGFGALAFLRRKK